MRARGFSYEREAAYYSRRWPRAALPYAHLEPYLSCWLDPVATFGGKRVLDVGAGECTYTRLIADRFRPATVVACDLFRERMLPAARATAAGRVRFVAADTLRLPFARGSFDVIFTSLVLCQVPDLDDVAVEMRRVLAAHGRYVGIEPNPYHPVHVARLLLRAHSKNQYLLRPAHLAAFERQGFRVSVHYFYAKLPAFGSRLLATCMGIVAAKTGD